MSRKKKKLSKNKKKFFIILACYVLTFVITSVVTASTMAWFNSSTWQSDILYMGGPVYMYFSDDSGVTHTSGQGQLVTETPPNWTLLYPGMNINFQARAVMEGVAFLIRKNSQSLKDSNIPCESIVAVGGGTKSAIWCQMWADITGIPVRIPTEQEAACLGAAMIGAVACGHFSDYAAAVACCVSFKSVYMPENSTKYEEKFQRFCALYKATVGL